MKTKLFFLLLAIVACSIPSWGEIDVDGIYYDVDWENHTAAVTWPGLFAPMEPHHDYYNGDVIIPKTFVYEDEIFLVTVVGGFTFCEGLVSVSIPSSVTIIAQEAFSGCTNLKSVSFPRNSIKEIGNSAFYGCSSLTSIDIPESVISIGSSAFSSCSSLMYLSLGSNLKSIERDVFRNCSSLISVTIPNSVTSIGDNAFSGCSSLTSVTIGSGVTRISDYAFGGCSSLTSIVIPNSVTTIKPVAFYGCESLADVTLGNSLTYIGDDAFTGCALTSITCKAVIPPVCGDEDPFLFVDRFIPLYVPAGSVDAYKAADTWKEFYNIHPISSTPTTIEDANVSAVRTRKVLNNGMMYILMPDGRTYDMQGKEVK